VSDFLASEIDAPGWAGAFVKHTHVEDDATPLEVHLTDRTGRARFFMPKAGTWLLNVF
jgi:hypothetical protein